MNECLSDMPKLSSIQVGRSDFWCSIYAFSQKQGLTSSDGYKVYSKSTKLVIPANSCNEEEIEELRLDGYSRLRELEIGENSFGSTKRVLIDHMTELRSMHIAKGSFSEKENDSNELHVTDCSHLNVFTADFKSFQGFKVFDLQGRSGLFVPNSFAKPDFSDNRKHE